MCIQSRYKPLTTMASDYERAHNQTLSYIPTLEGNQSVETNIRSTQCSVTAVRSLSPARALFSPALF